jgi:hypothetical protein
MTILADIDVLKLARIRREPNLVYLPFSMQALLGDIHSRLFPDVAHRVRIYFVSLGPLACISYGESEASIYVHQLLNHPDTPKEVMTTIIKHELLHLRIKPITIPGKKYIDQHPPEFREAERAIAPEKTDAWMWIWSNFLMCLHIRPRLQRIDVRPSWRERWSMPVMDIEECRRIDG